MTKTKTGFSRIIVIAMAVIAMMFAAAFSADAAEYWPSTRNIKTYVLSTSNNTTVYKTANSTSKYGTIYASDLITINAYEGNRLNVTYPVSGGTKTGYIDASAVLKKTNGTKVISTFTAQNRIYAYRRPSGSSTIGYIDPGDKVWVLYNSSGKAHVIYPVSGGGYKMGWINVSEINPAPQPVPNNKNISFSAGNHVTLNGTKIKEGTTFYTWNKYGSSKTTSGNYDSYPYIYVNGSLKNVGSAQCMAYSRYVQQLLYGANEYSNSSKFSKSYHTSYNHSTSELKRIITSAGAGANLRVGYSDTKKNGRHNMVVLATDSNGFYFTDANRTGSNTVHIEYFTWKQLQNKYQNIYTVTTFKG